jgi:DNA modification methylase
MKLEKMQGKLSSNRAYQVTPRVGHHLYIHGDSSALEFSTDFDLVLTCPPFFHPRTRSLTHGKSPNFTDPREYAKWVAPILLSASGQGKCPVCIVKTDVKYQRKLIPVGFRIIDECESLGLPLAAHWIWQRYEHFTPYSPSTVNIFVLGRPHVRSMQCNGHTWPNVPSRVLGHSTSFTPQIFEALIEQLTSRGNVVLDPFAGVGSAIIAAHQSQRWSVAIDISSSQLQRAKVALVSLPKLRFAFMPTEKPVGAHRGR